MPTYEVLTKNFNEAYDCEYWERIRVLYEGAKRLRDTLATKGPVRDAIFPRHLGEEEETYQERCKRACYIPYMNQLIDYLVAILFSDPIVMGNNDDLLGKDLTGIDAFYHEFFENTSKPGTKPITFNALLKQVVTDALLFKRAWLLMDFPQAPTGADGMPTYPENRQQEIDMGLDRAYIVPVAPECVLDWEYNDDGYGLKWALMHDCRMFRPSIEEKREKIRETFTVYTMDSWTRYTWEYTPRRPPSGKSEPQKTESGSHTFGMVPLMPFEIADGLWAGGKLENIAIELFNKLSALNWGHYRSLFQILVVNLQNPDPLNPVSEDGHRAVNQTIGPGRVWVGAQNDKLAFAGPDAAPFTEAREAIKDLRDELHRVLYQMSQSVDNSAGAMRRSADSKKNDQISTAIICKALGKWLREDVSIPLCQAISMGRKDEVEWQASGMDSFDEISTAAFVEEAAVIETIPIPSVTFKTLYKYDLATRLLVGATDEDKQKIMDELQNAMTAESLVEVPSMEEMEPDAVQKTEAEEAGTASKMPTDEE